jgi:hypothetical protein
VHLDNLSRIQRPYLDRQEPLAINSPNNKAHSAQTPQPPKAASLAQNPLEQEPLERQEPLSGEPLVLSERTQLPLGILPQQPHPLPLEPVLIHPFCTFANIEVVLSHNLDNRMWDLFLFLGLRIHHTKLLQKKNLVKIIAPNFMPSP